MSEMFDPIISTRRLGNTDDPYIPKNESHIVKDNRILLSEIPDSFQKVQVTGQGVQWIEVHDKDKILSENEYRVDYFITGIVEFHPSRNNSSVQCSFFGTGITSIPASRVWSQTDGVNVTETLQDIIDDGRVAIDALGGLSNAINRAETLEAELDADITTGNMLHTDLTNDFTQGNTLKTDLDTKISEASSSKTSLETSITNSVASKTNLDNSITSGSNLKASLDTNISTGTNLNTNLETNIASGQSLDTTLSTTITAANTSKSNLDASVQSANTTKANLDVSVDTANSTKTALDISNTTATNTKSELDSSIASGETLKLDLDSSISQGNTTKTNLDSSINSANTINTTLNTTISDANTVNTTLAGNVTNGQNKIQEMDVKITEVNTAIANTNTATSNAQNLVNTSVHMGDYNPTASYVPNNNVRYNGSTYRCILACTGIVPTDATYFTLVAQRGMDGTGSMNSVSSANGDILVENGSTDAILTLNSGTGANQIPKLDSNAKLPLSIIPDTAKQQTYVVLNSTERNALTNLVSGDRAFETSTGDSYIWTGIAWTLMADADWANVSLDWVNINGKPTSTVEQIDSAVVNSHTHANKDILDGTEESFTTVLKGKLDGIAPNANNYIHPDSHPATMITEDTTHRFVTDTDKANFHTHTNKTVLDNLSDTEGQLLYNGSSIGTPPVVSETEPATGLKEGLIWYKSSTDETKVYLNGQFRDVGGASKLVSFENVVNVTTPAVSSVTIGIPEFNNLTDILIVHKNTVHLSKTVNYTVNADNLTINAVSGTWENAEFHFLVLKNVEKTAPSYDGTLITNGSIGKSKLNVSLQTEIDAKATQTDLQTVQGDIGDKLLLTTPFPDVVSAINDKDDRIGSLSGTGRTTETVKGNAEAISTHTADTTAHITAAERTTWNAKADQTNLDAFKNDIEVLYWMGGI